MRFLLAIILLGITAFASCAQTAKPEEVKKFKDDSEVPRISLEDAKKAFDDSSAIIIDARPEATYKQDHIKGAINIPIGSASSEFDKLPKGKKIIVYCSWPNEHTSASLAFQMNQKGIPNVFALLGGTQAWINAKYPMEKSE